MGEKNSGKMGKDKSKLKKERNRGECGKYTEPRSVKIQKQIEGYCPRRWEETITNECNRQNSPGRERKGMESTIKGGQRESKQIATRNSRTT